MGAASRAIQVISLNILVVALILLMTGVSNPFISNPTLTYLVLVLDSCSYEVARDLVKEHLELYGRILTLADLNQTFESPLVVLANIILCIGS